MRSAKKSNAALGHEDAGDVATAGVSDVKRLQPADIATTVHVERGETTAAAGPPTDRDRPDDGYTVRKGATERRAQSIPAPRSSPSSSPSSSSAGSRAGKPLSRH